MLKYIGVSLNADFAQKSAGLPITYHNLLHASLLIGHRSLYECSRTLPNNSDLRRAANEPSERIADCLRSHLESHEVLGDRIVISNWLHEPKSPRIRTPHYHARHVNTIPFYAFCLFVYLPTYIF